MNGAHQAAPGHDLKVAEFLAADGVPVFLARPARDSTAWDPAGGTGRSGYWLPRGCTRGEFARRFLASSDLFQHGLRRPQASVNFIAAHDGRPLADVVSYAAKYNHAKGEDNR